MSGPRLVLGPLLRHVGARDATIWVETDARSTVEVRCGGLIASAPTFQVAGHFYALVVVDGLEPGSIASYEVRLDGSLVWPPADSDYPPSLIRTFVANAPVRLLFGSCRSPVTVKVKDPTGSGQDVLGAYARRMVGIPPADWPQALLMLGDQVYADETSVPMRDFIRSRRDVHQPPFEQVANFEEYTRLYAEAWGDPDVRWLLSTMPSSMIFDDHDVLDDWNTSAAWRAEMLETSWWRDRINGAFMSYWVYQHIGNLSPTGLAEDAMYQAAIGQPDAAVALRTFAERADGEADGGPGIMWSYRRDFGPVRLLVINSRAGRVLIEGRRSMIGDAEFEWVERQVEDGSFDHLIIGTSVPWLLPRALHDVESFDEAVTAGSRGRRAARLGERLRRSVDLEHWAAFRLSFDRLQRLIRAGWSGQPDQARAGHDLRPVGRRPSHLCFRGNLSGSRPVPHLPADLLPVPQFHPAPDATRVQGLVEPECPAAHVRPRPFGARTSGDHGLAYDRRPLLRQPPRPARHRRAQGRVRPREIRLRWSRHQGHSNPRGIAGPYRIPTRAPSVSGRASF